MREPTDRGGRTRPVPRKRFGQNFLEDVWARKVVAAIAPQPTDAFLEIGPGPGALTRPLADAASSLVACEIDRDLAATLRDEQLPRVTIVEGDFLKLPFEELRDALRAAAPEATSFRVAGNLPYNVSTPLLFRIADLATRLRDAHFMLQREVVDRMVAAPGSAEYGRLSVMLQYRFRMEKVLDVAPESFRPAPKVRSAVVRLVPHPVAGDVDVAVLAGVVTAAFTKRRKMLRNALEGVLPDGAIAEAGLDPACRPETVSLEQFVALARLARQPAGE